MNKLNHSSKSRPVPGRWSMVKRDLAVVSWISFLSAALGSFIIFALVDPQELTNAWALQWEIGRKLGYSLGFLFLFFICLTASGVTVFMIRTGPRRGHAKGKDDKPVPMVRNPQKNNPDLDFEDWL